MMIFLTPTWSFDEIVSTIWESNVILPKNPEKAANKPDTTENFNPAIFSMKISQVRFTSQNHISRNQSIYYFFFLLTGGLFTFCNTPQSFQIKWLSCCRNSRYFIKTVKLPVLPEIMLCMGFLLYFLQQHYASL